MDMRGLATFISDLRKCTTKEQEQNRVEKELAKIRAKFKSGAKLVGYERKKYVCKMLYIYMLGYEIDFGHIEAINLLSSDKYSEKHMGYLACTLLLNENHELVTLITNCIKRDLNSQNPNDQCLGLTAIANIGGKEAAEALTQDVQKLLVEGESKLLVKKKAALTMLRLFKKYPEILPPDAWAERVISLLNAKDFGVLTSVMSLLIGLAEPNPAIFKDAVPKVIRILVKLVLNREYPSNYLYYGIPAPWLQVKLLRFLQYYDMPEDKGLAGHLSQILQRCVTGAEKIKNMDRNKSVSRTNAAHAVFFEAMNLLISYDDDKGMLVQAAKTLSRYLQDKDTNLRYLSLDTMSRLALSSNEEVRTAVAKNQDVILFSLKDQDISIRRRALDLLYSMCTRDNAGLIVGEMLAYLPLSDYAIREELVLKIAILAEKYATDITWYVDVILNLLTQSGDFVSEDIWYRVIQIVTNKDEELQKYTAATVFRAVNTPASHENTVKVAGYLLGEFGYLVAEQEETSARNQLKLLESKFETVGVVTKQMLLSTFIKFFNLYEDNEVRNRIKSIFNKYRDFIDAELQQRANEYFNLAISGNFNLMGAVFENMPPFPERESSVFKKILERQNQKQIVKTSLRRDENGESGSPTTNTNANANGSDSLLEMDNGSSVSTPPQPTRPVANSLDDLLGDLTGSTPAPAPVQRPPVTQAPKAAPGLDDLLGDLTAPVQRPPVQQQQPVYGNPMAQQAASIASQFQQKRDNSGVSIEDNLLANANSRESDLLKKVHEDAAKKFTDLVVSNSGVAIEDQHLQVNINSEFHRSKGRIDLQYNNKTIKVLSQLRALPGEIAAVKVNFSQLAPLIAPSTQISQYVQVECQEPFAEPVVLSLIFEFDRTPYRFNIRMPIVVTKFIEPLSFADANAFFGKWKSIQGGDPLEVQEVVKLPDNLPVNVEPCKKVVSTGFRMEVNSNIDPNPSNFVAGGTFHSAKGNHPVLLRLETNAKANAYRLTVRTTDGILSKQVHSLIKEHLLRPETYQVQQSALNNANDVFF